MLCESNVVVAVNGNMPIPPRAGRAARPRDPPITSVSMVATHSLRDGQAMLDNVPAETHVRSTAMSAGAWAAC